MNTWACISYCGRKFFNRCSKQSWNWLFLHDVN